MLFRGSKRPLMDSVSRAAAHNAAAKALKKRGAARQRRGADPVGTASVLGRQGEFFLCCFTFNFKKKNCLSIYLALSCLNG
jgi:hypothetical protein